MRYLLVLAAVGSCAAQRLQFDVASIKMYAPGATVAPGAQGFAVTPDGIRATHVTIRGCLQWAYGIVDVSGPTWTTDESYDIIAKASGPVPAEDLHGMMQSLLEERFKLKVHRDTTRAPVGVLIVGKNGVKNLRPVQSDSPTEVKRVDGRLEMTNAPMSRVASVLGSPFGNMPLEKMADETGLAGRYDISVDLRGFNPREFERYEDMRLALLEFVSDQLETQYGLKLERRMMPVEVLVVDGGNKVPGEN